MIRSSKVSIKFSNKGKVESITTLLDEYKRVCQIFVDILWEQPKVLPKIPKEFTDQLKGQTWLSARMIQCAAKQSSGIVRGTRKKQEQRLHQIKIFTKDGQFKKARKLQGYFDKQKVSKPNLKKLEMELDERFCKISFDSNTSFDGWVVIGSIGNKQKLLIPFKSTKHLNQLRSKGILKKGVRLSKSKITFIAVVADPENFATDVLAIDIGVKTCLSATSNNGSWQSKENKHGWTLDKINHVLSHKKKGSKAFGRVQKLRTNYINWTINQLNFNGVKTLKIENIKNLRYKSRTSRWLQHFVYREIFDRLEQKAEELGVQVQKVNPTYTSQRCSHCGWVRKTNRKGQLFKCTACGETLDADLNASLNIRLDLPEISKAERLLHKNRIGFYWNVAKQESIVPATKGI